MKVKVSLSGDGIKQFFVAHCEKIGLALIVLLCAWLVLKGYQREVTNITPDKIRIINERAQENIQKTEWIDIAASRVQEIDFRTKDENVTWRMSVAGYVTGPLQALTFKPQTKRTDPELYTVEDLEVVGGFEPIATADRNNPQGRAGIMGIRPRRREEDEWFRSLQTLSGTEREKFEGHGRKSKSGRMGFPGGGSLSGSANKAVARPFVSILGVVPIRRQMEEYDRCFKEADGYVPQRDTPNYVYHYIRRREVSADGTPGEWNDKGLKNAKDAVRIANQWQGRAPEVADNNYLYQQGGARRNVGMPGERSSVWGRSWPGLHWPLPTLLLCDITPFALHSKVPALQTGPGLMDHGMFEEDFDPDEITEDAPDSDLPGRQTPGFKGRKSGAERGSLPGAIGPGVGMGPGMGMGMGMGMGPRRGAQLVDYYLFRVFDFEVVSGKTYQYQVRLLLDDPNNSRDSTAAPPERVLHHEVIERRRAEKGKKGENYRKTEWSEISPLVRVPDGRGVFAGLPKSRRPYSFDGRAYEKGPAYANVMAVVWDSEKQIEVYRSNSVTRGSAVNMKGKKFQAINPAESKIVELVKEFNLQTNIFVLDLRGGRELPGRQSDLLETSEMLLLDSFGRMSLHNETDDYAILSCYDIDVNDAMEQMKVRGDGGLPGPGINGDMESGRKPRRGAARPNRRRRGGN